MKISVSNEINYYFEANSILMLYNKKDTYYKELLEALSHKYNVSDTQLDNMFEKTKKIFDYVMSKLIIPDEIVDLFLTATNDEYPSLIELITYACIVYNKDNIMQFSDLAGEEKLKYIVNIISFLYESDDNLDIAKKKALQNIVSITSIINYINSLDIDINMKYRYIMLVCNIDSYIDKAMEYVDEVIVLLKENDLQAIADEFYKVTKIDLEKHGDKFFEQYDTTIDFNEDITLHPSIIITNCLLIKPYEISLTKNNNMAAFMGINVKTIFELKKEYFNSDERTFSILKALGDKSKFDILSNVAKRQMYGTEIARALNITTATVSHHMSNLYNLSLVNVIADNNKVNYSLNKEAIKELIINLEKMFL